MGSYHQSNAHVEGFAGTGTLPQWWPSAPSVLAISSQSPNGPGDVLVRSQLSIRLGTREVHNSGTIFDNAWPLLSFVAAGEVYSVGAGGFPDPTNPAQPKAAIRGSGSFRGRTTVSTTFTVESTESSLGGFVHSRARRGPNEYGPGHPEMRVGIHVANTGITSLVLNNFTSVWEYELSCIWFTP